MQVDVLNREIRTTMGLVVSDIPQRVKEPMRVLLSKGTYPEKRLWVKTNLVRTVDRDSLFRKICTLTAEDTKRVDESLKRILCLKS